MVRKKGFICILVYLFLCVGLYIGGYYYSLYNFDFDNIRFLEQEVQRNPALYQENQVQYVKKELAYINKSTVYIIEDYNMDTKTTVDRICELPFKLLGMGRSQLINYISKYPLSFCDNLSENISKEELDVSLVSFSESKVVIRRSYREDMRVSDNDNVYTITAENGYIIIYKGNNRDIFLKTEIMLAGLEEVYIKELLEGVCVKDIYEIYGYLEAITS